VEKQKKKPEATFESKLHDKKNDNSDESQEHSDKGQDDADTKSVEAVEPSVLTLEQIQAELAKNKSRRQGPRGFKHKKSKNKGKGKSKKNSTKKMAVSNKQTIDKKTMDALDASKATRAVIPEEEKVDYSEHSEVDADVAKTEAGASSWSIPGLGSVTGLFSNFSGNKPLTSDDLQKPIAELKNQLISKNVAMDIADKLCASVKDSLVGKKISAFTRVKTMVAAALSDALTRVLTPKKSIDIVASALQARQQKRPYTIVFIGINGVGKSTSLSKVCYYLKRKNLRVMIAACDTYRSAAVEQLQEHGKRLSVPVFNKGYHKDPAEVARHAILHGQREEYDVVLIDTAGRMQNNTRLLKGLAKLVDQNNPDLVLFVGEALVGNDGIDQLEMFNRALEENSAKQTPRGIDGIILTKFDTVDDKVGASLSMVYQTRQPIVFVGTGQKYTNLKLLNPATIIQSLFAS